MRLSIFFGFKSFFFFYDFFFNIMLTWKTVKIFFLKYYADVKNYGSLKSFGFIYILVADPRVARDYFLRWSHYYYFVI